jgi:hypothetical protein
MKLYQITLLITLLTITSCQAITKKSDIKNHDKLILEALPTQEQTDQLNQVLSLSGSWQTTIKNNLKQHADGEDFGTKDMIGIDLYTLVVPLTDRNLAHMTDFVVTNRVDFVKLAGVSLLDFIQGKGEINFETLAKSRALENFLPGKITGDKNTRNFMEFLIGVSKGKISPNLLVAMYYVYGQNNQSPANWSNIFGQVAELYQNNNIGDIAPLTPKTKEQNIFLQQMNLSLSQNPQAFGKVLEIISKSAVLKNVNGLKYLIDEQNQLVAFFDKSDPSNRLLSYYPYSGQVVINNVINNVDKINKVELKPIYQSVKKSLIPNN